MIDLVIVTGLSGAGKTAALNILEDNGFLCIDNLPIPLISQLVKMLNDKPEVSKLALALDVRNSVFSSNLYDTIHELKVNNGAKVIFVDADDKVLVKRFKEKRRPHPLSKDGSIITGIHLEREKLANIVSISNLIDTSFMTLSNLKESVLNIVETSNDDSFKIILTTFGFKHGICLEADLVFDVRFIKNPFYEPELKYLSGYDERCYNFCLNQNDVEKFLVKVEDLIKFLVPLYKKEGKEKLVVGIGCTGGRQRSVSVARKLKNILELDGVYCSIFNRDLEEGYV